MSQTVVMVGNLCDGFEVIGPFDNFDNAAEWDQRHNAGMGWVMTMKEPSDAT